MWQIGPCHKTKSNYICSNLTSVTKIYFPPTKRQRCIKLFHPRKAKYISRVTEFSFQHLCKSKILTKRVAYFLESGISTELKTQGSLRSNSKRYLKSGKHDFSRQTANSLKISFNILMAVRGPQWGFIGLHKKSYIKVANSKHFVTHSEPKQNQLGNQWKGKQLSENGKLQKQAILGILAFLGSCKIYGY